MPHGGGALGRGSWALLGQAGEASQWRCCLKVAGTPFRGRTSVHCSDGILQEPDESASARGAQRQEVWGSGIGRECQEMKAEQETGTWFWSSALIPFSFRICRSHRPWCRKETCMHPNVA